jgi:hypothetical protein
MGRKNRTVADTFDLEAFEDDLDKTIRRGREAFSGKYSKELNDLAGLSRSEIDAMAPGITDLQKYDELIAVVKEASRVNLAQAELRNQIQKLGDIAVSIAKRVPSLAAILA